MKSFKIFTLYTFLVLLAISCGKDEEEKDCSSSDATGLIEAKNFTFGDGRASVFEDQLRLSFFHNEEEFPSDICNFYSNEYVEIFGTLPNKTGRIELFLNFTSGEGETLTLFDQETTSNVIISEGYVEFTNIDDANVDGYMELIFDEENNVCGKFSLKMCD